MIRARLFRFSILDRCRRNTRTFNATLESEVTCKERELIVDTGQEIGSNNMDPAICVSTEQNNLDLFGHSITGGPNKMLINQKKCVQNEEEIWNSDLKIPMPKEISRPASPSFIRGDVPQWAKFFSFDQTCATTTTASKEHRFMSVAITGPPNAGKSTLMNRLIGMDISAVSGKVNTTTDYIKGIYSQPAPSLGLVSNTDDKFEKFANDTDSFLCQLEFVDGPGVLPVNKRKENLDIASKAWIGFEEAELILLVLDTAKRPDTALLDLIKKIAPRSDIFAEVEHRYSRYIEKSLKNQMTESAHPIEKSPKQDTEGIDQSKESTGKRLCILTANEHTDEIMSITSQSKKSVVLVLNKLDKVNDNKWLRVREKELCKIGYFQKIFYTSAKTGKGVDTLLAYLKSQCKNDSWKYPEGIKSTLPMVGNIEQCVKKFVYSWYNLDVPYKIRQRTIDFRPMETGGIRIQHELVVKDTVVLRMVVGLRNRLVTRMETSVSKMLENIWNISPVIVKIWVKADKERLSKGDKEKLRLLDFRNNLSVTGDTKAVATDIGRDEWGERMDKARRANKRTDRADKISNRHVDD